MKTYANCISLFCVITICDLIFFPNMPLLASWAGLAIGTLISFYQKKRQKNNQILQNYFNQSQSTTIPPSNWKAPIQNNTPSQTIKQSFFHKKQWKNPNRQTETESYAVQASHRIPWVQNSKSTSVKPIEPIENLIVCPFCNSPNSANRFKCRICGGNLH